MKKEQWIPSDGIKLEDAALNAVIFEKNALVVAGPGAGKTELLAQKAGFLFNTDICKSPKKILAISFKKDAASNLKERIIKRYGDVYKDRFVSLTYDAFFKGILDRFYRALPKGYQLNIRYEIADDEKLKDALVYAGYGDLNNMKPYEARKTATEIINNTVLPIETNAILRKFWDNMMQGDGSNNAALSFTMIAKLSLLILQTNPNIKKIICATYSHVFLDEFQDTTSLQYCIVKKLFKNSNVCVTAVGDNKQRIMLWAGAMKTVFNDYLRDFGATEFRLIMNHRSAPRLIELQKDMYASLRERVEDVRYSSKWEEADGEINLLISENEKVEAKKITEMICDDISKGIVPNDICIICKQMVGNYSNEIINSLKTKGIRARVETEYQDLLKDELIKIILDVICLSNDRKNPKEWDNVLALCLSLFPQMDSNVETYTDIVKKIDILLQDIREAIRLADSEESICAIVNKIIDFYGEDRLKAAMPEYRQGRYMQDILSKFVKCMWGEVEQAEKNWCDAVSGFRGEKSIPIMTIHKSKGLEYSSVYFIGLEDSAFWSFKNQSEEDRCAFFVALSRAKRIITFTYCEYRYNLKFPKQKRTDINEFYELLKKPGMANIITVREESP